MTYGDESDNAPYDGMPSSNATRGAAREKAQKRRLEQKKKDKRTRLLVRSGIGVGLVAIVAIVTLAIVNGIPKPNPGPLNMLSDGIRIGENFAAEKTAALQPGAEPVASLPSEDPEVVDIRIYLDYMCTVCGTFEATNAEQIGIWVESGAATVEFHPVSFLDKNSLGSKYSTRAANSAACVANYAPDDFFAFNDLLFANQPQETTAGLTDDELFDLVAKSDAANQRIIKSCIEDQKFKKWVEAATVRAFTGPLPNADVEKIVETPTVLVNGKRYTGAINDAAEFATFVSTASGNAYGEELKQSLVPSGSPSPSATPTE